MTNTALAAMAAALVAAGAVVGWFVFRETPDAAAPQSNADIAALRATLAERGTAPNSSSAAVICCTSLPGVRNRHAFRTHLFLWKKSNA